jgi:hypothetical protein
MDTCNDAKCCHSTYDIIGIRARNLNIFNSYMLICSSSERPPVCASATNIICNSIDILLKYF